MYFLNINKPKGISSFDVIRQLRKKLRIKAIGHSGTLDPLASGVMQIAVGDATRLLEYLDCDKTYIANFKFGYNSTTMDEEGDKTFISSPDFSKSDLDKVLDSFLGVSSQIPPKYSAIKYNGRRLCDIVRSNPDIEINVKPREIEIYSIKLLNFNLPYAEIEVRCSKGTYIRSLVQDIGMKLGCGAYITNLKRIKAGNFNIKNSDSLDCDFYNKINPLDAINLDIYELNDIEYQKIKNGVSIFVNQKFNTDRILLTKNKKLVSVANLSDNLDNLIIKPKKNFIKE